MKTIKTLIFNRNKNLRISNKPRGSEHLKSIHCFSHNPVLNFTSNFSLRSLFGEYSVNRVLCHRIENKW